MGTSKCIFWRSRFWILSRNISPEKTITLDSPVYALKLDGNHIYALGQYEFTIINITTPSTSYIEGNLNLSGSSNYDVEVKDNFAYLSAYGYGILSVNITNKSNPTLDQTTALSGTNHPWRMNISGDLLYIGMETDNSLLIYNISNPINLTFVGNYTNSSNGSITGYSGVYVNGDFAYVNEYQWGN